MGIRLMEENITKITSSNVLKFKPEVIVDVAKAEMVKMQVSEAHINTHEENILANC